jgi:pyruvate-formate lyase
MTQRIELLRDYILDKKHNVYRRTPEELGIDQLCRSYKETDVSLLDRTVNRLSILFEKETPIILPGEKIVFTRTITYIPEILTKEEWAKIKNKNFVHERGSVCNLSPDYETTLIKGLDRRKEEIKKKLSKKDLKEDGIKELNAIYKTIELVQQFIEKYEKYADSIGETEISKILNTIKHKEASSFREALQLLRILHFTLWESSNYHNTLGRFDQYMYKFFIKDIETGVLTSDDAFELLEEFFLTCNKDSDLYPGMQQGDNGQSMVLGGTSLEGKEEFNILSEMCLKASLDLKLIDPKINLRVSKNTPLSVFEKGSELTKIGLGFPQYNNDNVVIPGLIRKGYKPEDAHNYVVAACWEFIIPKFGMDIPNIDAVSLADCVSVCVNRMKNCKNFEDFYLLVENEIQSRVDVICQKHKNLFLEPAPFMSLLMAGTIENGRDISKGSVYNNYGIHGTGIATAADSLAAIKLYCFEKNEITYSELMDALSNDFIGYNELQKKLRTQAPKMGQDDDYIDNIAAQLLESFDKSLISKVNERGGVYRAGTGTAMYYISHSCNLIATPDGRNAGEAIPANYSPSLFIKHKGPVSIIKSFSKPNLTKTINGGPLTLEFDDSVFRGGESIKKLAMLVKSFITYGGHQLQLNTVSREKLIDAKVHPEKYRNLIVRVWGWSGYFVELDEIYQDHIINRLEFTL